MMRAALALLALVPATALRVTVLGGNGYVGQRVCEKLVARGCDVTSISKSGKAPSGGAWTQSVKWVANDLTRGSRQELEAAVGQPDVAVSCVGTVGFDGRGLELGNGVANVRAAEALKGVQRFAVHESNFAALVMAESRPARHRRDACSTAWRCRFLAARRSQHGRVIVEKCAPDTLVDFHTGGVFVRDDGRDTSPGLGRGEYTCGPARSRVCARGRDRVARLL